MQTKHLAAVLIGGLFLAPAGFAQTAPGADLAYATSAPHRHLLVVLQSDNGFPSSAQPAVKRAAAAARAGRTVEVVGGPTAAAVVQRELVRDGAPAASVVVSPEQPPALKKLDPLDDIVDRTVTLRF